MQKTNDIREFDIKHVCPGCGRTVPFSCEYIDFCWRCHKYYCREGCIKKTCLLCKASRCNTCFEQIYDQFNFRGLCEVCSEVLASAGIRMKEVVRKNIELKLKSGKSGQKEVREKRKRMESNSKKSQ